MFPVPRVLYNGRVSDLFSATNKSKYFHRFLIQNVPCDFIDSIKEYWWQIFTTYLQEATL